MSITYWQYIVNQAEKISDQSLLNIKSIEDWKKHRGDIHEKYVKSVGLEYKWLTDKCDLKVREHGEIKGDGYRGVKLSYQIIPDCWSSGVLFFPDPLPKGKNPAVLYTCGHGRIGIFHYRHEAIAFARRGYICFIFDTIEQNDNPGSHKGVYPSDDRLDWISLGYMSSGAEILNSVRAIDLLESIPEVDKNKIGVTGISGGGAHSFYLAAMDERIKAVATVAGVTRTKHTIKYRHFLNHCDCMYINNAYKLDNASIGALIAPRPALFCYPKDDSLYSHDEYRTLESTVRKIYKLYGCEENCSLFEYPGPHAYQPETYAAINSWFDKHVSKKEHPPVIPDVKKSVNVTEKEFSVFNSGLPIPDKLDVIPELLINKGSIALPQSPKDWVDIKDGIKKRLLKDVFRGFALENDNFKIEKIGGWADKKSTYSKYSANIDGMDLWIESNIPNENCEKIIVGLTNIGEDIFILREMLDFYEYNTSTPRHGTVAIESRCTGFNGIALAQYQILLRAGMLTGVTPLILWMEDLQKIINYLFSLPEMREKKVFLYGNRDAGVAGLYYALFNEKISGVIVNEITKSHLNGAYIPGILKIMDVPQAVGLMAPRPVGLTMKDGQSMKITWAQKAYGRLDCRKNLVWYDSIKTVVNEILTLP